MTGTGAYDPATNSGYLRFGRIEQRLVNGVRYWLPDGEVKDWFPKSKSGSPFNEWPGELGVFGISVDPQTLLDSMRRHEAKITETGRGVFHFEMTFPRGEISGIDITVATNGDVTVGADGRVAKVAYQTDYKRSDRPQLDLHFATLMEFSGYGAPVMVEKP